MTTTQTARASEGRSVTSATVSSTAAHQGWSARPRGTRGAGGVAGAGLARSCFSGGMAHLLAAVRGARDGERGSLHWTTPPVAAAGRDPVGGRSKSGRRRP
jgi:hypothetical protein